MVAQKTFSTWRPVTKVTLLIFKIILISIQANAQTDPLHAPLTIPEVENQKSIFIYPDEKNLTFSSPDTINATFAFPIRMPIVRTRCKLPGREEDEIISGITSGKDNVFHWVLVPILLAESSSCRLEFNPVYSGGLDIAPYVPKSFEFNIRKSEEQGVTKGLPPGYTPTALGTYSITPVPTTSSNGTISISSPTPAPSVSSSSTSKEAPSISVGAIAGISIVSGILTIGIVMIGLLVWRRRQQKRDGKEASGEKPGLGGDLQSGVYNSGRHELETPTSPSELWDTREDVRYELPADEKPGEMFGDSRSRQEVHPIRPP